MGYIFKPWKKLSLFTRIMIGFVLGIIVGLVFGADAKVLSPLGTILTNLLTMIVAPLVLCLLVCAAADVGDGKKLGRMGVKTVVCFLLSTAIAIVLGLVTSNFVIPFGAVMNMNGTAIYEAVAVVFTAQIFGIELSFTQQVMISIEF